MVKKFPSYRFHPEGHLALIHSDEECKALPQWTQTPAEDFVCPAVADFDGLEQVPVHLQGTGKVEKVAEPVVETGPEDILAEVEMELKSVKEPLKPKTKASLVSRLNKIKAK